MQIYYRGILFNDFYILSNCKLWFIDRQHNKTIKSDQAIHEESLLQPLSNKFMN